MARRQIVPNTEPSVREILAMYPGMTPYELIEEPSVPPRFKAMLKQEMVNLSDDPFTQNFPVKVARSGLDMGQGIKQAVIQGAEALSESEGLNNLFPQAGTLIKALSEAGGGSQAYTDSVNKELEQYNRDFPEVDMSSLGRVAGYAAPAMLLAPESALMAGALGAAEGAAMFTEENDPMARVPNAMIGAAAGGGGTSVGNMFTMNSRNLVPKAQEILEYASKGGYKVRPSQVKSSAATRGATNVADSALVNPGPERILNEARDLIERRTMSSRDAAQAGSVPYNPNSIAARYMDDARPRPEPGSLQEGLDLGRASMSEEISNVYDEALNTVIDDETGRTLAQAGFDDGALLQNLRSISKNQTSDVRRKLDKQIDLFEERLQMDGYSIGSLMKARSEFGQRIQRLFAEEGLDAAPVKQSYKTITDEMMNAAELADEVSGLKLSNATRMHNNKMIMEDVLNISPKDGPTEAALQAMLSGKGSDQRNAIKFLIDQKGPERVKYAMFQQMADRASDGGQKIVGPGTAAKVLRDFDDAIEMFSPDDAADLKGMRAWLESMGGQATTTANLPTGSRLMSGLGPSGALGVTVGAAGDAGAGLFAATMAGAVQNGLIPLMMRRRDTQNLLKRLSKIDKSKTPNLYRNTINSLTDVYTSVLRGSAVGATSPSDADIYYESRQR